MLVLLAQASPPQELSLCTDAAKSRVHIGSALRNGTRYRMSHMSLEKEEEEC